MADLRFALDHSDDKTLLIYFEPGPAFVKALDRASASMLASVAGAFMGEVVIDRGSMPPGESIVLPDLERRVGDVVGVCRGTSCNAAPPLACYKCDDFAALLNAPHGRALDLLLERRARLQRDGADRRMVNLHDLEIRAIAGLLRKVGS